MRNLSSKAAWVVMAAAILAAVAAGRQETSSTQTAVQIRPEDIKWMDGPPSLPAGAKFAVLSGDPKMAGLFVMRLKVPADYKVPPHSHPGVEHVTVISGALHIGMGDSFDPSKAKALTAGSYGLLPARSNHIAFCKEETIVQLNSIGPWDITYINPADDPRKKK
jgi:quercetin dioxygenase-like cupin family protein